MEIELSPCGYGKSFYAGLDALHRATGDVDLFVAESKVFSDFVANTRIAYKMLSARATRS